MRKNLSNEDTDIESAETKETKGKKKENPYALPTVPVLLVLSAVTANWFDGERQTIWSFLKETAGIFLTFFLIYTLTYVVCDMAKEKCKNKKYLVVWVLLYTVILIAFLIWFMAYEGCGALRHYL